MSQPQIAIKIYNRVIRSRCYDMVYKKKNNNEYFTDRMERQFENLNL